jgi:hypothetical protein
MGNPLNMYVELRPCYSLIVFPESLWISTSSIMMTRLMLNLRDPKLNGNPEESKLTTLRFNGQTDSGATNDAVTNTHGDEEIVVEERRDEIG